ncbi:SGNH hydrolase-type esterase domain-containing protein, partial [Cadophora sp. MPI-SDFR-AT-0126]
SNATLLNGPVGQTVPLKILPLGNSITYGYLSTDGNGYRKHLLDQITANGTAQYIGSVRSGNMTDNHNEGHPGATITQISAFSINSLALRPNLILLMAGTNDMNLNLSLGAPQRLANLVDMCSIACPDAVILLAQLTPAGTADVEARVKAFNPSVVSIAANREQNGVKVLVVDMPKFVTRADLKDNLHPNDVGYAKMADAWYQGIQNAVSTGWLTPPVAMNLSIPTAFSISTSSSLFSNVPALATPTKVSVPSVAVASQTVTNAADSGGGPWHSHLASYFAVAGLCLLL